MFSWREADCPGKKAWDPVKKSGFRLTMEGLISTAGLI
ncbi:hypothetical protein SynROS8604_03520 [Synechococcus sp. ROS8604]|nr:hypothetical protein SynROS8604_03520 [Synechococcus sp. ROS8604]